MGFVLRLIAGILYQEQQENIGQQEFTAQGGEVPDPGNRVEGKHSGQATHLAAGQRGSLKVS